MVACQPPEKTTRTRLLTVFIFRYTHSMRAELISYCYTRVTNLYINDIPTCDLIYMACISTAYLINTIPCDRVSLNTTRFINNCTHNMIKFGH